MQNRSHRQRLQRRYPAVGRPVVAACVLLAGLARLYADPVPSAPAEAVLHLTNGGQVSGTLVASDDPGHLRWQPAVFVGPFDFDLNAVGAVYFSLQGKPPRPEGTYCFELAAGDVLFGELLKIDERVAEVEAGRLGRLKVRRDRIQRFHRWQNGAGLIYTGPNGLADWEQQTSVVSKVPARRPVGIREAGRVTESKTGALATLASDPWRDEAGQLITEQPNVCLYRNLKLPARVSIEFEISWKKKADFKLELGVEPEITQPGPAFRIEAWDSEITVIRELEDAGDIVLLQAQSPGAGRVHAQVFLDQEEGRCVVVSARGELLASLTVPEPERTSRPGIRLTNRAGGDVRLERLRIARWNGEVPAKVEADKSRLHLVDGSVVYGQVKGFDREASLLHVQRETGSLEIPSEQIASVFLAPPDERAAEGVSASMQDSTRVSGELVKVDGTGLTLTCPSIDAPLTLPVESLRTLVVHRQGQPVASSGGLSGILEAEGVRLKGRLGDGHAAPGATAIIWRPDGSATASALRIGVAGRITYREPPKSPAPAAASGTAAPRVARPAQRRPANAADGFSPVAAAGNRNDRTRCLYLRTGDTIPCEVMGIDEHGVSFTTPLSDSKFVPHDRVKAVILARDGASIEPPSPIKRERLLTLPRLQKENPPTHLIRSRNGDYLRGRIVALDNTKLTVEVRLETREIPRERLSRIIWLHADELDENAAPPPPEASSPDAGTRVQALRSDGIRLTFMAEKADGGTLSGTSDVLGPSRVELEKVDQLLIGAAIEQAAARTALQQWKLKYALEPKFVTAGGSDAVEGRLAGTESALVGKPAPDFQLNLLRGGKFSLAGSRGRVVVLDFWATWCGPCMQALPDVARMHRDFADRNVLVVAVNLEEAPQTISGTLERHKLDLPVALDRDGAVAAKYNVTSIPQTLVINAEGVVTRHFIGGGPRFEEELHSALNELIEGRSAKVDAPTGP